MESGALDFHAFSSMVERERERYYDKRNKGKEVRRAFPAVRKEDTAKRDRLTNGQINKLARDGKINRQTFIRFGPIAKAAAAISLASRLVRP